MHRILVRSANWIGDHILAYPFFYHLRQSFPESYIGVACPSWVSSLQYQDVVNEIFTLTQPSDHSLFAKFQSLEKDAKRIKEKGPWDLGIALPNSFSSAYLLFRGGAKKRRGYSLDGRGFLLTDRLTWPTQSEHRSLSYAKLIPDFNEEKTKVIHFWGIRPRSDALEDWDSGEDGVLKDFSCEVSWRKEDAEFPEKLGREPYWVMAPGSTAESRRWPVTRFIELANLIVKETGWKGVVVGGQAEAGLAEKICGEFRDGQVLNWTNRGDIASLWKIFRRSEVVVCNDSGVGHVASLCGARVQIVWGAGDPMKTQPLGPGRVQFWMNPVECWPCQRNQCSQSVDQKLICLKGIYPDAVWQEIQALLKKGK